MSLYGLMLRTQIATMSLYGLMLRTRFRVNPLLIVA